MKLPVASLMVSLLDAHHRTGDGDVAERESMSSMIKCSSQDYSARDLLLASQFPFFPWSSLHVCTKITIVYDFVSLIAFIVFLPFSTLRWSPRG